MLLGKLYKQFVSSAVLTAIEYLIVAGGGAGGSGSSGAYGGSGGAGGYRTDAAYAVTVGNTYTVTVGAGGVYNDMTNGSGTNGGDSVFDVRTATGGGKGATGTAAAGNGGSGGAGAYSTYTTRGSGNTPSTSPVQGYDGADYGSGGASYAGGGSSAAASGTTAGAGTSNSISGSAVTYATGGQYTVTPAANTGQGGAGGRAVTDGGPVGNSGAAGVVIIRYPDSYAAAASTTGSPTITVAGGYRVYKWTTSGSITF